MFKRILIANRGEIALRIIRACKDLGIETVSVYSESDKNASYLKFADFAVCIGPGPVKESYLDPARIISAAEIADVNAIHPGYGLLSENPEFAEICESCNIIFIGPTPESSRLAGDKVKARELAKKLRIPTIPGSERALKDEKEALDFSRKIGYPIIIKAAGGGGGRGMRTVHNDVSLVNSFIQAQSEAAGSFKSNDLYLEKYIEGAHHVEVQVMADKYGNIIHLGERDCSIQRRFQKLLEEAPSAVITPVLRRELGNAAIAFARAAKYTNVGTVEFLVDERGKFYFIEMNARIQVEHPVTEMVTGIDIVKEQLKIAGGERLGIQQKDVMFNGAAIECRINAEDTQNGFRPCPGRVTNYLPPGGPGVRVDSHVYSGYEIPPYYDSMVAKLIVHRAMRQEAISAMKNALAEFVIEGVKTTIPLHQFVLSHPHFLQGKYNTNFLDSNFGRS